MHSEGDTVNFLYSGSATELMRELCALTPEDVTICDPDLDEVFMHYYAKEGN
jgi:ABC-2 type transport system ATP-binding protein